MRNKEENLVKIHKKSIISGVALLLAATIWVVSAGNLIDQNGVLGGRILSQNLVTVGTPVKEGTVLANVESITGAAVAAAPPAMELCVKCS